MYMDLVKRKSNEEGNRKKKVTRERGKERKGNRGNKG